MGTEGQEAVRGAPNLSATLSRMLTAHPRIRFVKASEHRIRAGILWWQPAGRGKEWHKWTSRGKPCFTQDLTQSSCEPRIPYWFLSKVTESWEVRGN